MIKAIVFDMDGVLYFEGDLFSIYLKNKYGIPLEKTSSFFHGQFQNCLIGKADLKVELEKELPKWGSDLQVERVLDEWFNRGNFDVKVADFIKELRSKQISCILCTNNEKYRISHIIEKFHLRRIFDMIITSHEAGRKKPDRRIFDKIIEALKLLPSEILFCDDDIGHVKAANEYGMKGLIFNNLEQLRDELSKEIFV